MPSYLDHAVQNAYSDLISACRTPAFDGTGLSFTKKIIKGKPYLYTSVKVGQTPKQSYLGPDDDKTRRIIEKEKASWSQSEEDRKTRARLVNIVLAGGMRGPTPQEGKILRMLERSGIFLAGSVLVGTPAFNLIGSMLGVLWESQFNTRDIDIAIDNHLPLALKTEALDIKKILHDSGMGFVEVPMLNRKHPSTSYKIRGDNYTVELLTPERGKPSTKPIHIPSFNAAAEPLRFLDYIMEETQPAAVPFDIGVLVNIPDPARFALHKLVISQRRPSAFAAKSQKDIDQAKQLLQVLIDIRPGSIMAAVDAAKKIGGKFYSQLEDATKLIPATLNPLKQ